MPTPTTPSGRPSLPQVGTRRPTELLHLLLQVSEAFERALADHLRVNTTDLQAMEHLIRDGSLTPGELARRLGISAGAVTTVVDRLEAVGHARRSQHPTDRRAVVVTPDAASVRAAMAKLRPMIGDIDAVLDGFSADEAAVIERYLDRVVETYRTHA